MKDLTKDKSYKVKIEAKCKSSEWTDKVGNGLLTDELRTGNI